MTGLPPPEGYDLVSLIRGKVIGIGRTGDKRVPVSVIDATFSVDGTTFGFGPSVFALMTEEELSDLSVGDPIWKATFSSGDGPSGTTWSTRLVLRPSALGDMLP